MAAVCELCATAGGILLWESPRCRVVRIASEDNPGFCRVIWLAHVREMTDLSAADRQFLMAVVFAVETVVRQCFKPDKINLASFGNMTPHLHWHIIPRWQDDAHFPEPIWGSRQRASARERSDIDDGKLADALRTALPTLEGEKQ